MDNKKENITLSAINVFREKGIEKATVSDIVKGAGIAQGTFYLYFPSKLAVMPSIAEVMVNKTLKELSESVGENIPFPKQLEIVIEVIFQITGDYREISALTYAGMASSEYLKEWESIYIPYYNWIGNMLNNAKNNGSIRLSIDTEQTAVLLIGLIESAADQSYLYDEQNSEAIEKKKQEVFTFSMHALS